MPYDEVIFAMRKSASSSLVRNVASPERDYLVIMRLMVAILRSTMCAR